MQGSRFEELASWRFGVVRTPSSDSSFLISALLQSSPDWYFLKLPINCGGMKYYNNVDVSSKLVE